jgi:hypothetical protein
MVIMDRATSSAGRREDLDERIYGGACSSEPSLLQRAVGERVPSNGRGLETVLDELRQAGCLKEGSRAASCWLMDIVMLNTGGGVAGGDRLDLSVGVGAGARRQSRPRQRAVDGRAGEARPGAHAPQ